MRYIDIEDLALADHWFADAEKLTRAVLRGEVSPSDHDEMWRGIKSKLAELFHGKCWFCESPIPRSDNAVDHFRPKGRVRDAQQVHSGNRWLAFERGNFRYACTFCNSKRIDAEHGTEGGKADRFPLLDEQARVYAVDSDDLDFTDLLKSVAAERAALLDPCKVGDWALLGCKRESGRACAASVEVEDVAKVEQSVDVYHLDHEPTCKQRHQCAVRLLEEVKGAKIAFLRIKPDDPESEDAFGRHAKQIVRMIRRQSPYSGEMVFLLRGQRSTEHPWIEQLLEV